MSSPERDVAERRLSAVRALCEPIAGVHVKRAKDHDCAAWHSDCLAARVLRILNGEDVA